MKFQFLKKRSLKDKGPRCDRCEKYTYRPELFNNPKNFWHCKSCEKECIELITDGVLGIYRIGNEVRHGKPYMLDYTNYPKRPKKI